MLLFVDLRGQTPTQKFSFYETQENKILSFNGHNNWSHWDIFEADFKKSKAKNLTKFREIVPDWVYSDPERVQTRKLPVKILQYSDSIVDVANILNIINDVSHNNGLHHSHMQLRLMTDFVYLEEADCLEDGKEK